MSKHTPGPWVIVEDYGRFAVESKHHSVCDVSDHDTRHEANARLIAAAPELLMACKVLLGCLKKTLIDFGTEMDAACTAIAKADSGELSADFKSPDQK